MGETKAKLSTWKGDIRDSMLLKIKFLEYSHVFKVGMMFENGANLQKKEKMFWIHPSWVKTILGKIEMKHKNDTIIAYITEAFETNTAINQVDKCKSSDWPNELEWKLLEELKKWVQPSNMMAMLEL